MTLWDIGSGAVLKELATSKDGITALAYSPDGTMLASGCHDSQLRVWNMRTAVSAARWAGRRHPRHSSGVDAHASIVQCIIHHNYSHVPVSAPV